MTAFLRTTFLMACFVWLTVELLIVALNWLESL